MNTANLIVSYSGSGAEKHNVGGLFTIVSTLPHHYEVKLLIFHPRHPLRAKAAWEWIAGLEYSNGRVLLKKTMVRNWVSSIEEYFALFERDYARFQLRRICSRIMCRCVARYEPELRKSEYKIECFATGLERFYKECISWHRVELGYEYYMFTRFWNWRKFFQEESLKSNVSHGELIRRTSKLRQFLRFPDRIHIRVSNKAERIIDILDDEIPNHFKKKFYSSQFKKGIFRLINPNMEFMPILVGEELVARMQELYDSLEDFLKCSEVYDHYTSKISELIKYLADNKDSTSTALTELEIRRIFLD